MEPRRQPLHGKRLVWLVVSLMLLIGGAAYAYQLTVTPVVVRVDGVELDCSSLDDSDFGFKLYCTSDVAAQNGRRMLAGAASFVGAGALLGLWRTRLVRTDDIVGDRISLRPATTGDRRAVQDTISDAIIDAHGWTDADTSTFLDALGMNTLSRIYLVEPTAPGVGAERVVGCMIATPGPDGAWWIGGWIGEPWQRSGFGTDAAQLVTERLFADGIRNVHVECSVDNGPVRSLLENTGFENMGEIRTRLPNDRLERAVRYAKHTTVPHGCLG